MRSTIIVAALLLAESSRAFQIPASPRHSNTALSLTSDDILARARQAAGVEEQEEQIFEDALLDDMQQILLTLEKRVKEGPGSIPLLEIEQFWAMATNVMDEMKGKENERLDTLSSGSAPPAAAPPQQLEASTEVVEAPPAPAVEATVAPVEDTEEEAEVQDISQDEGPKYEGEGGMGLAKGTANTWIIPGMDSMSPEEYQAAIQSSVSARQAKRKEGGVYGNKWTNDYLNNLGAGGGMLKKE